MAGPTATVRRPQRRSSPARAAAQAPAQSTSSGSTTIPVTVVATPAAAPAAPRDYTAVLYGLVVVLVGFATLLVSLWLIVINSNPTGTSKGLSDPTAFLGMVAITVAGLGGAFFGVALGLQGVANANRERAAAEAAKDAVQKRAERYLANLEPSIARNLVD